MRIGSTVLVLALLALGSPAAAADISSGKELVDRCAAYVAKGEDTIRDPDPCKRFLIGFFTAYKASEDARRDAMVKGLPATATTSCVRLPDHTTWRQMAQRLVNYGNAHSGELTGAPGDLLQHTIETDFPCPPRQR